MRSVTTFCRKITGVFSPSNIRAHEHPDPFVISDVEDLDDGVDVLEFHRLGVRLVFGQVIDAEKLIIAEKYAFHVVSFDSG
jgi:hypothetical protein